MSRGVRVGVRWGIYWGELCAPFAVVPGRDVRGRAVARGRARRRPKGVAFDGGVVGGGTCYRRRGDCALRGSCVCVVWGRYWEGRGVVPLVCRLGNMRVRVVASVCVGRLEGRGGAMFREAWERRGWGPGCGAAVVVAGAATARASRAACIRSKSEGREGGGCRCRLSAVIVRCGVCGWVLTRSRRRPRERRPHGGG